MTDDTPKGRGWHGDSEAHARIGRMGGKAPHKIRGLQALSPAARRKIAKLGGKKSRRTSKYVGTSE